MRTERVYSSQENHSGYGAGDGDTERYEYLCPCGKGRIVIGKKSLPMDKGLSALERHGTTEKKRSLLK